MVEEVPDSSGTQKMEKVHRLKSLRSNDSEDVTVGTSVCMCVCVCVCVK
jgi:hypothetical protein